MKPENMYNELFEADLSLREQVGTEIADIFFLPKLKHESSQFPQKPKLPSFEKSVLPEGFTLDDIEEHIT